MREPQEQALPRRMASLLLESAVAIAPREALEWGHAMLGELGHVEGNWSALLWSLGGAGLLAKQALIAFIFPQRGRLVPSGGDLFSKEAPMRKTALRVTAVCVAATLLMFLAPVFRQAFQISLMQWRYVFHIPLGPDYPYPDKELEALAKRAEQNRDAEGLAFVAMRQLNSAERLRLANEAVQLDPNLVWVYGVADTPDPPSPHLEAWIAALEIFDPGNALPHLMEAEQIDIDEAEHRRVPRRTEDRPTAWHNAMEAAFRSPKLDTYMDWAKDLNRRVLQRYRIEDPVQVVNEPWYPLPSYAAANSMEYAELLLNAGRALESEGDTKGAAAKYREVARYGQMMTPAPIAFQTTVYQESYKRLSALSQKQGNKEESEFYASLAQQMARTEEAELTSMRDRFAGADVSRWNGWLVRICGMGLLFSGGLLAACLLGVVVRGRSLQLGSLAPSSLTLALGCCAGVVSLLSSVVLYATYRPYAQMLQRFLRTGNDGRFTDLWQFLGSAEIPLGAGGYLGVRKWALYFWLVVGVVCLVTLVIALVRYWRTRSQAAATA